MASARIRLVHCASAGDEGGKPVGCEGVERPDDEVIMETQAETLIPSIGLDDSIRKWRVADGKIEMRRDVGAREVLVTDTGIAVNKPGNACGDGVEFNTCCVGCDTHATRHNGEKHARSNARLEDAPS